jgi:outer membrane protein TolC
MLRQGPLAPAQNVQTLEGRLWRYRDHLERTSRRLTLSEALAMGLAQNPSLAKAHALMASTRWSGVAIRREWAPSLKLGSNDPGLFGAQQKQADTLTLASPQLTLEWTFFDPTRLPRSKANAASLAADRFLFDVEARSLVLSLQERYFDLQAQLALEVDYRELSAMVEGWRRLAEVRARGDAATPDLHQLTSQKLALLILRIDTHEQVIGAASKLAQALSLPPGELVMPSEPLARQGQWTLSRQATIEQALRLREEIQRSLATARSLDWSALATRKRYLPTLSLGGSGSTQGNSISSGLDSEAILGMNVQWTLFDGGILAAQATSQRQQQEQALQQAALDRLTVTEQVETSYAAYVNSQIVVDTAIAQLESARASIASATRSYAMGRTDATTLLQVLANTRGAVEAYSTALRKHNRSVAELHRYSALWPETAQALLRQRLANLGGDPAGGAQISAPPPSPAPDPPGRGP